MFKFLISFIIGMILKDFIQSSFFYFITFIALCSLSLWLLSTKPLKRALLQSIIIHALLIIVGFTHVSNHSKGIKSNQNIVTGKPAVSAIIIENYPKPRTQNIITGRLLSIDTQSLHHSSLLELYSKDSIVLSLKPRDTIIASIIIKNTQEPAHKYAFNYSQHLENRGILYQGWIQKIHSYRPCDHYIGFEKIKYGWRNKAISIIKNKLSDPHASIVTALLVGYRNDLDQDLQKQFANSGAIHVLAVSGLHVGIIFGILQFCLMWLPQSKYTLLIQSVIISIGLILYALFTGESAPVIRSTFIFLLFIWNRHIHRHTNSLNLLAFAAIAIIIIDPTQLNQLSFQLSFAAVGGIILFYHKIYRWWYVSNSALDYLWSLTAVSLAAQTFILPLSLYYFHQFPIYFIFSSIISILCAFAIIGIGLPLLALGHYFPSIHDILFILEPIVDIILGCTKFFGVGNHATFKVIWFEPVHVCLLFISLISAVIWIRSRQYRWMQLSMFSMITFGAYCTVNLYVQKNQVVISSYESDEGVTDMIIGQMAYEIITKEVSAHKKIFITRDFRHAHGVQQVQSVKSLKEYLNHSGNE